MTKRMSNNYPQPGGRFDKVVAWALALAILFVLLLAGLWIATSMGSTEAAVWFRILTTPFRWLIYGGG